MSITSLSFIIFVFCTVVVYYLVPKRFQWCVLLFFSALFYLSTGWKNSIFVLVTSVTIYAAAIRMQHITTVQKNYLKENKASLSAEEKKAYKVKKKTARKHVMLCALLFNLGILAVFKYFHFALEQLNSIIGLFNGKRIDDVYSFIVPLGISFYTFQSVGYLLDVYFEYYSAERNYFKVLLFTSFFPQMTQGPISDFEFFSNELFSEHSFTYKNYSWGLQRMVWGFVKKLLIADTLAPMVHNVFTNYSGYTGIATLIGAFLYSIQIYADFSGYMDIMCGICEVLGIKLTENFERPYFSKSIAEYWRRWHISLGAWFKKYIYYTIGMSGWSRKLASQAKAKYGKHFGNTVPATAALLVVWTATGLWHGASWAYISWGLVNGLFIIFSLWMDPVYASWKQRLKINDQTTAWKLFQVIRTFVLVTFIKVLPEVGTLSDGIGLWKRVFTEHTVPHSLHEALPFLTGNIGFADISKYMLLVGCIVLLFVFSMLQRRIQVRHLFNRLPMLLRVCVLTVTVICIIVFGIPNTWGAGGFLYANF